MDGKSGKQPCRVCGVGGLLAPSCQCWVERLWEIEVTAAPLPRVLPRALPPAEQPERPSDDGAECASVREPLLVGTDDSGESAVVDAEDTIWAAAARGDVAAVGAFLDAPGGAALLNVVVEEEADSAPPLVLAAFTGQLEVVQLLLARGADVEANARGSGWTALLAAAAQNHPDIVTLLLRAGADATVIDHYYANALMYAADDHLARIVAALKHRPPPPPSPLPPSSPLPPPTLPPSPPTAATASSVPDIPPPDVAPTPVPQPVPAAAEAVPSPSAHDIRRDDGGGGSDVDVDLEDTIWAAAARGDAAAVAAFLDAPGGATLLNAGDEKDEEAPPPLVLASFAGNLEVVHLLLARGADLEATTRGAGCTALVAAAAQMRPAVVACLLRAGADASVIDNFYSSALAYAADGGLLAPADVSALMTEVAAPAPLLSSSSPTRLSLPSPPPLSPQLMQPLPSVASVSVAAAPVIAAPTAPVTPVLAACALPRPTTPPPAPEPVPVPHANGASLVEAPLPTPPPHSMRISASVPSTVSLPPASLAPAPPAAPAAAPKLPPPPLPNPAPPAAPATTGATVCCAPSTGDRSCVIM